MQWNSQDVSLPSRACFKLNYDSHVISFLTHSSKTNDCFFLIFQINWICELGKVLSIINQLTFVACLGTSRSHSWKNERYFWNFVLIIVNLISIIIGKFEVLINVWSRLLDCGFQIKEVIQSISNLVCPGANENKARYTAIPVACGCWRRSTTKLAIFLLNILWECYRKFHIKQCSSKILIILIP